jgi:hypothetical protein
MNLSDNELHFEPGIKIEMGSGMFLPCEPSPIITKEYRAISMAMIPNKYTQEEIEKVTGVKFPISINFGD